MLLPRTPGGRASFGFETLQGADVLSGIDVKLGDQAWCWQVEHCVAVVADYLFRYGVPDHDAVNLWRSRRCGATSVPAAARFLGLLLDFGVDFHQLLGSGVSRPNGQVAGAGILQLRFCFWRHLIVRGGGALVGHVRLIGRGAVDADDKIARRRGEVLGCLTAGQDGRCEEQQSYAG